MVVGPALAVVNDVGIWCHPGIIYHIAVAVIYFLQVAVGAGKAGGSHDSVRCGQCAVIQTSGLFGEAVVPACTHKLVRDSEHTAFLSGYLDRVKSPYRIVYQASLEISIGPESGE